MFFIVIFQFSSARTASQGMTVSAPSNQNLTASASAKATASQKETIIPWLRARIESLRSAAGLSQ